MLDVGWFKNKSFFLSAFVPLWWKANAMMYRNAENVGSLVALLERCAEPEPVHALDVAAHLGIAGSNDEHTKRIVRDLVKFARDEHGKRICSNLSGGYWLARDAAEWKEFNEGRRTTAGFKFVDIRKQERAVTDAMNVQEELFKEPVAGSKEAAAWAEN